MTTWWYAPHLDSHDIAERDVRERVEHDYAYDGLYAVPEGANLQGSPNGDGTHSIVLDLDCPHEYRASSTPGHGHLIIPANLTTEHYRTLLLELEGAGVITPGYVGHASRREWATFVRAPGVQKPADAATASSDEVAS